MNRALMILMCLAAVSAMSSPVFALNKQVDKNTTFEVPTTGRIIDVTYMPEFDEWWVKCQEEKGISVYTYDRHSKKWYRAQFLPARTKSQEKSKAIEPSSSQQEKPQNSQEGEGTEKAANKTSETQPAAPTGTGKREGDTAGEHKQQAPAKKWWDPRNILKLDLSNSPHK